MRSKLLIALIALSAHAQVYTAMNGMSIGAVSSYLKPSYTVDLVNGSNSNTGICTQAQIAAGTTSGCAWASLTKLQTHTQAAGEAYVLMCGGYVAGQTFYANGASITLMGDGPACATQALSNASFTKTGGRTNIYQIANPYVNGEVPEIEENGYKYSRMYSLAVLDSSPGSFYVAGSATHSMQATGATLYINTTDSSSPVSNGRAYTMWAPPMIDCSVNYPNASFVKTGGFTNLYTMTVSVVGTPSGSPWWMSVWQNGIRIQSLVPSTSPPSIATLQASADSTPNSFVFDSTAASCGGTGQAPVNCQIFLNTGTNPISDGNLYEYAGVGYAFDGSGIISGGTGSLINAVTARNSQNNGSVVIGPSSVAKNAVIREGNKHNILMRHNTSATNVATLEQYPFVSGTQGCELFISYEATGPGAASYVTYDHIQVSDSVSPANACQGVNQHGYDVQPTIIARDSYFARTGNAGAAIARLERSSATGESAGDFTTYGSMAIFNSTFADPGSTASLTSQPAAGGFSLTNTTISGPATAILIQGTNQTTNITSSNISATFAVIRSTTSGQTVIVNGSTFSVTGSVWYYDMSGFAYTFSGGMSVAGFLCNTYGSTTGLYSDVSTGTAISPQTFANWLTKNGSQDTCSHSP